jgi:hypothetical protein
MTFCCNLLIVLFVLSYTCILAAFGHMLQFVHCTFAILVIVWISVQDDNQITILVVNAPQFLLQFANGTVLLVYN